jgi:tetratricopeptide (TPR) repeat protein
VTLFADPLGISSADATVTNSSITPLPIRVLKGAAMLRDYRDWLESELKLLGNASHHAYSFGQANMAKRALERLDDELGKNIYVAIVRPDAMAALTALEMLEQQTTALDPAIAALRDSIRTAITDQTPPMTA